MVWTDGMLYPLLHRLDRAGLVEASWRTSDHGRRRKYYRLTDAGHAALVDQQDQWTVVVGALRQIWGGGPAGGIDPALRNLADGGA